MTARRLGHGDGRTLTVTPVNDAPTLTPTGTIHSIVAEDGYYALPAPGSLSGWADVDGDSVTAVLDTNTTHGVLHLNTNGSYNYTPDANYFGSDTFTMHAWDGSLSSNIREIEFVVTPVNDAPSFTKGADQTVLEDAGAQSVAGWATSISPGPANEVGAGAELHRLERQQPALLVPARRRV